MKFQSLEVLQFRNFNRVQLELSPSLNIFLGQNGQGKTNLLESVYLMTHGDSFRPGTYRTFLQKNESLVSAKSVVRGQVQKGGLRSSVDLSFSEQGKTIQINGKKTTATNLVKNFPSVLFSPESLSSIKHGPDQRRALVDDFLIWHRDENRKMINHYKRAFRARNKLFKSFQKGEIEPDEFRKLKESMDPSFLRLAAEFSHARIRALKALQPHMTQALRFVLAENELDLALNYLISEVPALDWSLKKIFDSLRTRTLELEAAEVSSGTSLVGPHKHDIQILFNEMDSRYYCSQGQQRALILSFKMAQIVYHREVYQTYPILLLDDVMSELDAEKRERLVQFLSQINAQILITTTDFENLGDLVEGASGESTDSARVFKIHRGQVFPVSSQQEERKEESNKRAEAYEQ